MKIIDKIFGKTKQPKPPMPVYRSRKEIEAEENRVKLTAAGKPIGKKMMALTIPGHDGQDCEVEIYHQHDFWFDIWSKGGDGAWSVIISGDFGKDQLFRMKTGDRVSDAITTMLQELYPIQSLKNDALNSIQNALDTLRRIDA